MDKYPNPPADDQRARQWSVALIVSRDIRDVHRLRRIWRACPRALRGNVVRWLKFARHIHKLQRAYGLRKAGPAPRPAVVLSMQVTSPAHLVDARIASLRQLLREDAA